MTLQPWRPLRSRRNFLLAASGLLGGALLEPPSQAAEGSPHAALARAMEKGAEYLLRAQSVDGGWRSEVYGQLKGGAALTALVLEVLVRVPAPSADLQRAVTRGYAFLEAGWKKRGAVAAPDGSLDFPTYGVALWLMGRRRLVGEAAAHEARAVEYLLAAQCGPGRGFDAAHPAAGGWDLLSAEDARGVTTGTNISITRHVLEALAPVKQPAAEAARTAARAWLDRCQQPDGGFAFTPEPGSLSNKAEYLDGAQRRPRSYAPPTCDGVRALLACGVKISDPPVAQGLAWLAQRKALAVTPGFEELPPERGWQRGLRFYYYAALSGVLPFLPSPENVRRQEALRDLLVGEQLSTGAWVSDSDRMRENDPLIATSLALNALSHCD